MQNLYEVMGNVKICTYCNSQNSRLLFFTKSIYDDIFEIRHCQVCNAYFLAPKPTDEILKKAYDESYYGQEEEKFGVTYIEKAIDFFRKKRAKYVSKFLKEGATVLDIGCGNGRFLGFLLKYGNYNIFGIEPGENSAKRAIRVNKLILKKGYLEKNDFSPAFFDAITMFHVFEHLINPAEIIDIIANVIKPNGILVISFPNINSWQAKLFKGKWLHLDPPRHLLFFKPDDFINIMKIKGFENIRTKYACIEQNPFAAIQSILNLFCKKRELLFESLKKNNKYLVNIPYLIIVIQKLFFLISFPIFIFTDIIASFFKNSATVTFIFKKVN